MEQSLQSFGGGSTLPLLFFGSNDIVMDDGSKYNPSIMAFIQDEWIANQIKERESEFTNYKPLRLFIGTWNVNGRMPKDDLFPWLFDGAQLDNEADLPDIYVIGLQEMVDLTAANVALSTQSTKRSKEWIVMLEKLLNSAHRDTRYVLKSHRYLVGLMICCFVKTKIEAEVTNVQDGSAAVGVMGVMGNKGGVSIRMQIYDSTFSFVCAHLAAHRHAVSERNADYASIIAKTEFKDPVTNVGCNMSILEHDHCFYFGDFNYRIDEQMSVDDCFKHAAGPAASLVKLLSLDQLTIERKKGRAFQQFLEGEITFRPTYKFQAGTSVYEQRPEKKLRPPAWCDRILWKPLTHKDATNTQLLYYGSVDSLQSSDHKPVHALFDVRARATVPAAKHRVMTEVRRKLDNMLNSAIPSISLGPNGRGLYFKSVSYGESLFHEVELRNTGQVPAVWRFVPRPEEKVISKPWISASPQYGVLPVGGTISVRFSVLIGDAMARDISLGAEILRSHASPSSGGPEDSSSLGGLLEEIFILRVEKGRDFFIPVSCTVLPTCFGASLAQLSRRPEPIAASTFTAASHDALSPLTAANPATSPGTPYASETVSQRLVKGLQRIDSDSGATASSGVFASFNSSKAGRVEMGIPKELWRLVDFMLTHRILTESGVFMKPAEPQELLLIRKALDFGTPLPSVSSNGSPSGTTVSLHAYPHCLLQFLSALREPVVPCELFPMDDSAAVEPTVQAILKALTPLHYNVLMYIVRFIREVLRFEPQNGVSKDQLCFVFSRVLLRKIPHDSAAVMASYEPLTEALAGPNANTSGNTGANANAAAAAAAFANDEEEQLRVSILGPYADLGTKWNPTPGEQTLMTKIVDFLVTKNELL